MPGDEPTILLVSMCGTPEEFLAAFRRYVDRHGLFIPTANPPAAGQRGRFALTLIDGGVLVEGVAEVTSSSPRPSALYGRTGMVLSFVEIDEESRETLAALDKAKLSLKAQNLAVNLVPRPSTLREPVTHPEVKLPSAASDRVQALAECVVVGDTSVLAPSARRAPTAKPVAQVAVSRANSRFAIPQIQPARSPATPATSEASRSGDPALEADRAEDRTDPRTGDRTLEADRTLERTGDRTVDRTGDRTLDRIDERSEDRPIELAELADRAPDGGGEATEVGPIVLEVQSQPSGPTLTNPAVTTMDSGRSGAAGVHVDPDFEATIGGPPPMPRPGAAPAAAAPPPERPSSRAVAAPRAGTDSTLRSPVETVDAPPSGEGGARPPSLPAIPRTLTPIPRAPSQPRPISPVAGQAANQPSGPVAAPGPTIPRTLTPIPRAPSPSIPRTSTPAVPLRDASGPLPLRGDSSGAARAPRGSTEAGLGNQPIRAPERASQNPVRKTSIGIAAVHVEPAAGSASQPVEAPVARPGVDVAAVPQIIHDSMFATEDATDEAAREAVPVASDHQATRREGQPRPAPRQPSPPARPSAPTGLPGVGAPGPGARSTPVAAPPSAPAARGLGAGPMPQPPAVPAATPPTGAAEHGGPARLGKSSAPFDIPFSNGESEELATELTPGLGDSGPSDGPVSLGAPNDSMRPSQPTVPIRPPAAAAALAAAGRPSAAESPPQNLDETPGSGPIVTSGAGPMAPSAAPGSGPTARPGSGPTARPGSGPTARPGSGPTARPGSGSGGAPRRESSRTIGSGPAMSPGDLLAASSSAPTSLEDAGFATVPTSMPGFANDVHAQSAAAALHSLGLEDAAEPNDAPAAPPQRKSQPAMPLRRSQPAIAFSAKASAALPFSDPGSLSAPIPAAAPPRPPLDPLDVPITVENAPAAEHTPEHSARHQRVRAAEVQSALDPKIEIDPALYAESAIDRSFEHNFVLPGSAPAPWQDVPTPWSGPPSAPVIAPPTPPTPPYPYQPYPGYDPAYPVGVSSGDETALVQAPGVRSSRTMVIVGSAILVILVGLGGYLYWDATKPSAPPPASSSLVEPTGEPGTDGTAAPGSATPEVATALPDAATATPAPPADAAATPAADCSVTLISTPAGATATFADKELGTTPLTTSLPCAGGAVTFRKAGAADLVSELGQLRDGQQISVELATRQPAAAAQVEIEITTAPVAARIRVNNKEVGRSPVKLTVPAGVPIVLSAAKDGRAASVKVTPTADKREFTLDLKRTNRGSRKTAPSGPTLDGI